MKNCPFCDANPASSPGKDKPQLLQRAWRKLHWLVPPALLVLMPKCPLCVVAYVALFTGIGITVTTARWIQILIPLLCVISLALLILRYWRARPPAHGTENC